MVALGDDLILLGGWDADGHLRGVEVDPEPDIVNGQGKALVGCESDAQLGADVEEGIEEKIKSIDFL